MAPAQKKSGSRARKVVGQKTSTTDAEATNVPKGGYAQPSAEEAAAAEHERDEDGSAVYITATNTSSFQLRAPVVENGRIVQPEWMVEFGPALLVKVEEGDETHDAFVKVLAGEWSDQQVSAATFQQNARFAGIGIKAYGLEAAPFPTWDLAEESQVIPLAVATGVLSDPSSIRRALKYEKQSPKRQPSRPVRESVVTQLEAILAASEATAQPGPQTVVHASGGNTQGAGAVTVGAAGLGGIGFANGAAELG